MMEDVLNMIITRLLEDADDAAVVEIFGSGKAIIADIDRKDGTETEWIELADIEKVVSR